MELYNHEEAGTRMLVHLLDAFANGATTCLVHTVDTDVIVLLAGKLHVLLDEHPGSDIWVALELEKTLDTSISSLSAELLEKKKSQALPVLFTGCDTTSSFFGKRKEVSLGSMEIISRGN